MGRGPGQNVLLGAAREALLAGDAGPFGAWLEASRPKLDRAARYVQRGRDDADERADLVQVGAEAAWGACVGYEYMCRDCRKADARFGSVLCHGSPTLSALAQHVAEVHPGADATPAATIERRVWYMVGAAMQAHAGREWRRLGREWRVAPSDAQVVRALGDGLDALRAYERDADRRALLARMDARLQSLAYALSNGLDKQRALGLAGFRSAADAKKLALTLHDTY